MGLDMKLLIAKKNSTEPIETRGWEFCYWRKANQIRNYFEESLKDFQDNGKTLVQKEVLEDLLKRLTEVLIDHSKAKELLPTCSGFFFGNEEYNSWYFEQILEVRDDIRDILNYVNFEEEDVLYWEWY